jgi:biotin carboxylase
MTDDVAGKHLLVLNATYRDKQELLVAAKRLGLAVTVVGAALPAWASPYVDRIVAGDPDDADSMIAAARRLHEATPVHGVYSLWDRDVPLCARVAEALGLPGCPPAAADRCRHKHRAREALAAGGVVQPRHVQVTTWDELVAASRHVGFPLVYKPVGASASRAILRVDAPDGLAAAHALMERCSDPADDPMFANHAGVRMVEEYLDGVEVSVEGLVARGRTLLAGVTRKWTTGDWYLEWRHLYPADVPEADAAEAGRMADAAVRAIGLDNSAFHVEIKLTSRGPRVVEINGRLGSDYITTRLVPLTTGYDMAAATLRIALGVEPGEPPPAQGAACVRFLFGETVAVVAGWSGVEQARALPGVVEVGLEKAAGEPVLPPPTRFTESRLAHVIAVGPSADEALSRAEAGAAALRCDLRPASRVGSDAP